MRGVKCVFIGGRHLATVKYLFKVIISCKLVLGRRRNCVGYDGVQFNSTKNTLGSSTLENVKKITFRIAMAE